jgi:predicted SAM-dependent methyltransferase
MNVLDSASKPNQCAGNALGHFSPNRRHLLHIGCGEQSKEALPPLNWDEEWAEIRVDIDPSVSPDIVASMTDLSPLPDQSIDFIFSKHNIEHLKYHDVSLAISEFHRVLKPEGLLVIRCPDIKAIAEQLLTTDLEETLWTSTLNDGRDVPVALIDMIYGARSEIEKNDHFMAHQTGFTDASLRRFLDQANFDKVNVIRYADTLELRCVALKVVEGNLYPDLQDEFNRRHIGR